jgi:tRNA (cmo5U34)-methyltransferase
LRTSGHVAEDWFNDAFVASWLTKDVPRATQRQHQFVMVRAHVPFKPEDSFRYINLGAGGGGLDEVILKQFPHAEATLLDGSPVMLSAAGDLLAPFGDRVTYAQGNFATPEWRDAVNGTFDVAVSTIAIHNLFDGGRIRALYGELFQVMNEGGFFVNFDLIRMESPQLRFQAQWAQRDPDAGIGGGGGGGGGSRPPGTMAEQLGWLREAGFVAVDCFWREYGRALFGGWRGGVRTPDMQ